MLFHSARLQLFHSDDVEVEAPFDVVNDALGGVGQNGDIQSVAQHPDKFGMSNLETLTVRQVKKRELC